MAAANERTHHMNKCKWTRRKNDESVIERQQYVFECERLGRLLLTKARPAYRSTHYVRAFEFERFHELF